MAWHLTMNPNEESYRRICDGVWALYGAQLEKDKRLPTKRQVFLPPPPRAKPVDLLVVGISPSPVPAIDYPVERKAAERFTERFLYVSAADKPSPGLSNDTYYEPLLQFVRRIDERFGVWPQVARGERPLLVEFTDALHLTSDHNIPNDLLGVMNPQAENCPVCAQCKEILAAELTLYHPKVVLCNGRLPSKFVWEICTGRSFHRPVKETMLEKNRFGCRAHFSGYLNSKWMDGFSRARLLREILEHTKF